jgi:hypothetical protein
MRSHSPKRRAPALLGNGPSPATCLHQHRTVGAGPKPEFDFVGIDPTSIVRSSPSSMVAALLEAFLPPGGEFRRRYGRLSNLSRHRPIDLEVCVTKRRPLERISAQL